MRDVFYFQVILENLEEMFHSFHMHSSVSACVTVVIYSKSKICAAETNMIPPHSPISGPHIIIMMVVGWYRSEYRLLPVGRFIDEIMTVINKTNGHIKY